MYKDPHEFEALCFIVSLTTVPLYINGWPCGYIFSNFCLNYVSYIPILISCLITGFVFVIVAGILQIVAMMKKSERLLLPSKMCCWIAAVFYMAGIFYYYDQNLLNLWSQNIAGFAAGMLTTVAVTQVTIIINKKFQKSGEV